MNCLQKLKTKIQRGLRKRLNLTKFLYILNVVLIFYLIYVIEKNDNDDDDVDSKSTQLLTIDRYNELIENSMQVFDYMKLIKNGQITKKPETTIVHTINEIWCWNYPEKPANRNIIWSGEKLWQTVSSPSNDDETEIYVYSAYYDTRIDETIPFGESFIQIFAMVQEKLNDDIFCQIWWSENDVESKPPLIVKAISKHIWEKAWDPRTRFYVPYLFTCPVRRGKTSKNDVERKIPRQVSVTTKACRMPTNLLRVNYDQPKDNLKHNTVVCVKGMDFLDDLSLRFIEWIEANYVVGADKIVIYTYAVHPEVRRVIEYYETKNRIVNIPLTLPGRMPNVPLHRSSFIKRNRQQKRRNEIIPYNDCMYRHLYTHEYVLIVDVDELIVPLMHDNWENMLNYVKDQKRGDRNTYSALSIANAFFFDNLTRQFDERYAKHLHMLRHDVRSKDISGPGVYGKSFMQIENIATVFNHFPLHKLRKNLRPTFHVDPRIALKNHYKEVCPIESRDECPKLYHDTTKDHAIRKFANEIKRKVEKVLKDMNKIPNLM